MITSNNNMGIAQYDLENAFQLDYVPCYRCTCLLFLLHRLFHFPTHNKAVNHFIYLKMTNGILD